MKKIPHKLLCNLEYWHGNNMYGIGNILKEYAGLPQWMPLNFRIQHGVTFWTTYCSLDCCPDLVEFYVPREKGTLFLTYNEDYVHLFHEKGIQNVRAIGAPFIYLDDLAAQVWPEKRKGTIVFPQHSGLGEDTATAYDAYAEQLAALPARFHPITVCLYFVDLQNGCDRPFREKGFAITSNGAQEWDLEFLRNFIRNAAPCEYATSNCPGSSACYYAIHLGLKTFRYGPPDTHIEVHTSRTYGPSHSCGRPVPHDFSMEACEDTERQKAIADLELGTRSKLSKKEMRRMILGALTPRFLMRYLKTIGLRGSGALTRRMLPHRTETRGH